MGRADSGMAKDMGPAGSAALVLRRYLIEMKANYYHGTVLDCWTSHVPGKARAVLPAKMRADALLS